MCLALATVASAAPQFLGHHGVAHHGVVGHHAAVHAPVLPTPVSGAIAPVNYGANKPVNGYGHGQVSHQSVSKPYQGEHRSTTQSKAFGAHAAVVADGESSQSDPPSQTLTQLSYFQPPTGFTVPELLPTPPLL